MYRFEQMKWHRKSEDISKGGVVCHDKIDSATPVVTSATPVGQLGYPPFVQGRRCNVKVKQRTDSRDISAVVCATITSLRIFSWMITAFLLLVRESRLQKAWNPTNQIAWSRDPTNDQIAAFPMTSHFFLRTTQGSSARSKSQVQDNSGCGVLRIHYFKQF